MDIQISGLRVFPRGEWRNAILHYLTGVWAGHNNVTYRPKVCWSEAGFSRMPVEDDSDLTPLFYELYAGDEAFGRTPPFVMEEQTIRVSAERLQLEAALVRFVRNDKLMMLVVDGADHEGSRLRLFFWKKRGQRQFLGIAAERP